MHNHRIIIQRISDDERTFAIIDCELTAEAIEAGLRNHNKFQETLTNVVTELMISTWPNHEDMWEYAGSNINIGDLVCFIGNEPLFLAKLATVGILNFKIQVFCDAEMPSNWTFDTALVHSGTVEDFLAEKED